MVFFLDDRLRPLDSTTYARAVKNQHRRGRVAIYRGHGLRFPTQLQISRKAGEFVVDRLRRMDMLKLLAGGWLLRRIILN